MQQRVSVGCLAPTPRTTSWMWMDSVEAMRNDVATVKTDMIALRGELVALRREFDVFRHSMRADFAEFRQSMDKGLGDVRQEIAKSPADLLKWSFVFWVGAVGAIAVLAGVLRR